MTTFASPMRVREVCDSCKRNGFGHGGECDCNVVTLPAVQDAEPADYQPDAFTQQQEEKDRIARANNEAGDVCLRWTRCGHKDCRATYGPIEDTFHVIDRWEADHECYGCNHREPEQEPIEIGPEWIWPYPKEHPFHHHMERIRERTPMQRPKRRRDDYTPHWVPAVLGNRAA